MEEAWPFLIGRTQSDDHRIVVIPAFMTDAPLASALPSGTGGEPAPAGAARVRELRVPGTDAITAVYRIFMLDAHDYGLPGSGLLTDRVGRPIAVTEGLVLRRPATVVADLGITEDHLNRARALVTTAYQAFWTQGGSYRRRYSAPFALTAADGKASRIVLTTGLPWQPDAALAGSSAVTASTWGSAAPPGTRIPVAVASLPDGETVPQASHQPAARCPRYPGCHRGGLGDPGADRQACGGHGRADDEQAVRCAAIGPTGSGVCADRCGLPETGTRDRLCG